jgi:galactose mutarotase-like enzyme
MQVQLATDARWPLDSRMNPLGAAVPLSATYDFCVPRALGDAVSFDDAFRMAPETESSLPRARLIDPSISYAVEIRADPIFGTFVVYAPLEKRIVALEPYTCAPDAFNLAGRGIASGARDLAPGETFAAGFEIRLSAL